MAPSPPDRPGCGPTPDHPAPPAATATPASDHAGAGSAVMPCTPWKGSPAPNTAAPCTPTPWRCWPARRGYAPSCWTATAPSSTWAAPTAWPPPPRNAPCSPATSDASSPAAPPPANTATSTTSSPGPTAARRTSPISPCSAPDTTARSTPTPAGSSQMIHGVPWARPPAWAHHRPTPPTQHHPPPPHRQPGMTGARRECRRLPWQRGAQDDGARREESRRAPWLRASAGRAHQRTAILTTPP